MSIQPHAVLVDWGTSSFRLWVLDKNGNIKEGTRSDQGMSRLSCGPEFSQVLEGHLSNLGFGIDVPVVICGMAGAKQGWQEAIYVDAPTGFNPLVNSAIKVSGIERDVRILPGIAQRSNESPDVMRGEETQLLGASEQGALNATICMPGTHSKWVVMKEAELVEFTSFMTGELYQLLLTQSTLSHSMDENSKFDMEEFERSAALVITDPDMFARKLFSVRAGSLLGYSNAGAVRARLSGLLIGLEISGANPEKQSDVILIGDGYIVDLYQKALNHVPVKITHMGAEEAVCVGLKKAANIIWPK